MKFFLTCLVMFWPGSVLAAPASSAPASSAPASSAPAPDTIEESWQLVGELSADFRYASLAGTRTNAFEMQRSELGILRRGDFKSGGELLIEAIRSAGPDSFSGIDGDSLLIRLKRAWGFAREDWGPVELEARAGLLATPWIETSEAESELRFLDELLAERAGLYFSSDLGALVRVATARGEWQLMAGVFNGEGRNQTEQNNGKNTQLLVSGTAVHGHILGQPWRLRLHAGGQEGSLGPSAASNHRLSGGLSFLHRQLSAGAEAHYAFGVAEVSSRDSRALGFWLRARWRNLSTVLRYDNHRQDLARPSTSAHLFIGGLFAERQVDTTLLRLGLAYRREQSDAAASPVPGLASAGTGNTALVLFSASVGSR
jgi:hypothetical protein